MSVPNVVVFITSPSEGAQIGRTVTVTGSAGLDNNLLHAVGQPFVQVSLGDTGGGVARVTSGAFTFTGDVPDHIPDGSQMVIRVDASQQYFPTPTSEDPLDANPGFEEITVQVRTRPPELFITGYQPDVVASLPYQARIDGTTSGAMSGITKVEFQVDGGPSGLAQDNSGDWSSWTALFTLTTAGDYPFHIIATDSLGRTARADGTIELHERFESTDADKAFGSTIFLRELSRFAARVVSVGGGAGPTPAALAAQFHQPYDRLPDPAVDAVAKEQVVQARVAVEVLRRSLATAAPADLDQRLRALAYSTLLQGLGTSADELRQARAAAQPERIALAARLGFVLEDARPDRLDRLTISPDVITDDQLENIFGFRSMLRTDPFQPITAQPDLGAWRQASLRQRWAAEDAAERAALPVIDPDHVSRANLASQQAGDPVLNLWTQRDGFLSTLAGQIDTALRQGGGSTATFDAQVTAQIGRIDLTALATRDAAGEDVRPDLAPFALTLPGLLLLVRTRGLLASGALTNAEWADVRDILVGVRKRRVAADWRTQEIAADVVLQPQQFLVDPDPVTFGIPPAPPSVWRVDPGTHEDWLHTLTVRGTQAAALPVTLSGTVQSAELVVLPAARDELIALIGARHTPPEVPADTAQRLTRELAIDLLSSSDVLTTRADAAAETLLTALFALRSGRLAIGSGGQAWSVADEQAFDDGWVWYGSFATWYAAITSFAYPENHLFPALYVQDGPANLQPTPTYQAFLDDLRAERMTPRRAEQIAQGNLNRMRGSLPAGLPDIAPVTQRPATPLSGLAAKVAPFYTGSGVQQVRELFWLIPVALAQALQLAGEFPAALDWYQYAYAYRLPITQRRIFPGLVAEHTGQTTFDRPANWPVSGSNPHEVARHRADAYTRSTVMSIVRCLLALAETEFVRNTAVSNGLARSLYETALDLISSADAVPVTGPDVPFPANAVWESLRSQAATALSKIHQGLNVTGARVGTSGEDSTLPSQYRSSVLIDRAKNLVGTAQQLESVFLTAIEQRDNDAYTELQAGRDIAVAQSTVSEADLKVTGAGLGIALADSQLEKSRQTADHFTDLLAAGLNEHERDQLFDLGVARDLAAAGGVLSGLGSFISGGPGAILGGLGSIASGLSSAASLDSQSEGLQAGFERRADDWRFQQSLAQQDVAAGRSQVALAQNQQQIAQADQQIALTQLTHASATADFLAGKFTNTELFDWMAGVLNEAYRYFLQQATAVAALAEAQLAFERQEPSRHLIQSDYWQGPPDPVTGAADTNDRRGLTGSERLLADITRLDEFAFETDRRKLHLSQTLALSELVGSELQRFRETGVLTFATPQELFDRDFPGHYLRLIKRVTVSVIALVPVRGIRATLSASGVSRTVVARGPFETVTLRRDPESIAFTSPVKATGLFELESDTGLLLPFEGMGVDTAWRLEMAKPANPLDFRTIADVLLTIDYTALDSADHRRTVIRGLDRTRDGDRTFSLRDQFPDTWYDLNNPDTVTDPARRMHAFFSLTADDFPSGLADLRLTQLTMFVLRDAGLPQEITLSTVRHTVAEKVIQSGAVTTVGGVAGTRRTGGATWLTFTGDTPAGDWELQFQDTDDVRSWFATGLIQDVVLVMTVTGDSPAWP